ncbi:SGNH/GDSL hydrolase family protein [Sphingomonas sp. PAMC26645]|uniref:SGNH/GDSL hydrolase family protein n=1 Tax=Sphingomonas sp. PAMC26645 TaxID=2565555 RepID=UPI00109DDD82|nr:SGNH/GDSL hydrolase family protein [Sphingomonas sp. PAMC26645]QCB42989.1 SGNH/GDSL hydrolase family protein [Sphingomonas sp. PAMC26645]
MATAASLTLDVWRNDELYEFPLRVRGPDLTGVAMRAQVRLAPDTPGAPLVDLALVTNGNAEGIRLAGVSLVDGVFTNDVRIRLNKSTRQALPYAGELGDAALLALAFQIAGRTRLFGNMRILAHAIDSDAAPTSRPASYGAQVSNAPSAGATLTIGTDDVVEVTIDGADLVSLSVVRAEDARDEAIAAQAATIAIRDEFAVLVDGRRLPKLKTAGAKYHAVYSSERLADGYSGPLIQAVASDASPRLAMGLGDEGVALSTVRALRTGDVARVSRIYDQSGAGRDLTQTSFAYMPAIREDVLIGGKLPILFDGRRTNAGDTAQARGMLASHSLSRTDCTFVAVIDPSVSAVPQIFWEYYINANGSGTLIDINTNLDGANFTDSANGGITAGTKPKIPSSPFVMVICLSPGGSTISINGAAKTVGSAFAPGTLARFALGYGPSAGDNFNANFQFGAAVFIDKAVTDEDADAISYELMARFGITPPVANLVIIGDSIHEAVKSTYTLGQKALASNGFNRSISVYNLSAAGVRLSQLYARRTQFDGQVVAAGIPNVALLAAGINDINNGVTAADLYAQQTSYVTWLKANGYAKVLISTLLPETVVDKKTVIDAYNALVRSNTASAEGVVDYAADAVMGAATAPNDVTLYADKLHPVTLGYRFLSPILEAAVNMALAA